jgi:hypothetical protein
MRPLSAAQLFSLWEYGLAQPAWQRALSLLAAALPDSSPENLASLPLGQRDAYLLALRESLFGPHLASLATCPSCGERLELAFDVADVRAADLPGLAEKSGTDQEGVLSLDLDGLHLTFRLPNSLDLAEIAALSTPQQARQYLLERCMLSAEEKGVARTLAQLPEQVTSAIVERMASADPQGDVQIALTCPACAHQWQVAFDILSYLWSEIQAWAQRMLREVHLLAQAYGWREADILALSPWRRGAYLQMIMG